MQYLNELGEQPADCPFTAYFNMDMLHCYIEVEDGVYISAEHVISPGVAGLFSSLPKIAAPGSGRAVLSPSFAGRNAISPHPGSYLHQSLSPTGVGTPKCP